MEALETITRGTLTAHIYQDDDPESPREWSNVGTMVCWHRGYNLGDEQPSVDPRTYLLRLLCDADPDAGERLDDADMPDILEALEPAYVVLPLYLYDHSGITMRTSAFSCPWDSGQVGFIYVSILDAGREWSSLEGEALRERASEYLRWEVETYDQYLTGDVYGVVVEDADGEHLDSCWGFHGWDYALLEAARMLEDAYQDALAHTVHDPGGMAPLAERGQRL